MTMMMAPPVAKPRSLAKAKAPIRPMPRPIAPYAPRLLQRKCACDVKAPGGAPNAACAGKQDGLQRKLSIGSSNDPLERETDRVADEVMADRPQGNFGTTPVSVQRHAPHQAGSALEAPASVHRTLAMPGRPLDTPLRRDMEARFGHDFSQVRVHQGTAAEQSARDLGAQAYTVGRDIAFGAGRFEPETTAGRRLLAHELTHVAQQGEARGRVLRPKMDMGGAPANTGSNRVELKEVAEAVDLWEQAFAHALDRLQLWTVRNMLAFQADWLTSEKGNAGIKDIEGDISAKITEAVLTQIASTGIGNIGKAAAAANFSKLFLASGSAAVLANVFSLAVGMILAAVVDAIKDTSTRLVKYTVAEVTLWASKIIQSIDKQRNAQLLRTQRLRNDILFGGLAPADLASKHDGLMASAKALQGAFQDTADLSAYHKLTLTNEVLDPNEVLPADRKPLETIVGEGAKIVFVVEHDVANKGPARVFPFERNTVVVGILAYDCYTQIGNEPWNIYAEGENSALTDPPPPRTYFVELEGVDGTDPIKYSTRSFPVRTTNDPKSLHQEFGTWYNVPKGRYRIRISRSAHHHYVGLCGLGEIKVAKAD